MNNNYDEVPMNEIIEHLCDESEMIQKKIYQLSHDIDDKTAKELIKILDDFERLDASCYKLKNLHRCLKKMI
ncbi:MAG: hypothetical protein U0L85_10025 [Bacilli bacterium]|nr:hypothetical protein [Bacilli bacterium]